MGTTKTRYPAEVRERAVRLFREQLHEHSSRWAATQSIATKIGCTTQTLSSWVQQAEVSADPRQNAALADRVGGRNDSQAHFIARVFPDSAHSRRYRLIRF